mgnify:CR=1 FL=1
MNDTAQIVNRFVDDNHKIDKEKLRLFVNQKLSSQLAWVTYWLHGTAHLHNWNRLADFIASHDRDPKSQNWQKGLDQIMGLPATIRGWNSDHCESIERLEFSIASKAAELATGDDNQDYYTALTIRHDQLLACTQVMDTAIENLGQLVKLDNMEEMIQSEPFGWFMNKDIDTYIYESAREVYELRNKLTEN